ncbi:TonB-dependent receptor [Sphingomonas sp.]|uniref:TonB-dependent receptor domain-containing protein n=1 Tax=Sphingomonas sp. TaxID=28214 RepID=UPI0031DB6B0C
MTNSWIGQRRLGLLATVAPLSMLLGIPAFAQTAPAANQSADSDAQVAQASDQTDAPTGGDIIVTGSIVRNPAAATASPVVSISAQDLQNRGVTTVADALQLLTANNAGTAPPSWSSFGFATGASSPSLRGLNNAYTLTIFNGMRTAPYPLGDDGYRNFVDINTIPSSIVERIDTLLDGASATYGSDAIAGVVNVIIKRQITGLHLNASTGISQRGDNGEQRISATAGYGDLDTQGFNIYVNGEYQKNDPLFMRDRGYPFNTADQSRICGTSVQGCLTNGIRNGVQYDGTYNGFQSTRVPYVRPYDPATGASLGGYQLLNPTLGCQGLQSHTLTAAERAASAAAGIPIAGSTPATVCQEDLVNEYRAYNSNIERKGFNIRATGKLGPDTEVYAMFNYYNTTTSDNNSGPQGFTGQTAAGGTQATVSSILLPAYVCSNGVGVITTVGALTNALTATGCNAANGTLNPNNPFAAQGQLARLVALPQVTRNTSTNTKTYRFSAGINGVFGNGFNYNVGATASQVTLDRVNNGYLYLQGLMNAVAQGTYNFVDQSQNTAAQTAALFPQNRNHSYSKLGQVQASVNKDVFALPGGDLNIAVIGQYRHEEINNPSSNPANETNPNARYFGINAVGVVGKRDVWSAGYEITAPILDVLKVKAEGSYDSYSTGQSRFSPKFEAEFRPVEQIKFRGTYSRGFRIPSFSESFALPTTGYVTATINCSSPTYAAFCQAHASNPSYYQGGYSYGLTSSGNPNLQPEKTEGFTGGVVLNPVRNVTFTVDYFQTRINNVIIPAQISADAIAQYYTNNGKVTAPGITVTPGVADQQNPGALPLLGFAAGSYKNADTYLVRGLDFSLSANFPITADVRWRTIANASRLLRLEQTLEDGTVQRYDGTLGPCNITSCSGAPHLRASWQNTLDFNGRGNVSLTAYYTSSYSSVATDAGGVYGDCAASAANGQLVTYNNGDPVQCRSKSVFYLDGHAEVKVQDSFTFYLDVKNLLDRKPAYEPNAGYGLYQFNPAWSDSLFIGRFVRFGAKVDF